MGFISHKVERSDLEAGDHIYSWRGPIFAYSHHGIYVGGDNVVHFNADNWFGSSCSGTANSGGRVVMTSLHSFMNKGSLRRFQYGVSAVAFMAKVRGGTCTTAKSDPPEEVIRRAMYLLHNGFGKYHLLTNNCEIFAVYCKTGLVTGSPCGQAATATTIPVSASTASFPVVMHLNIPKLLNFVLRNLPAQLPMAVESLQRMLAAASMAAVNVSATVMVVAGSIVVAVVLVPGVVRYFSDVGVRNDAVKVNVEDLAALRSLVLDNLIVKNQ